METEDTKTLDDLSPLELVTLAIAEVRTAMREHETDEAGPASGAYAYLHLAAKRLAEADQSGQ